jgi:hypothetical protein
MAEIFEEKVTGKVLNFVVGEIVGVFLDFFTGLFEGVGDEMPQMEADAFVFKDFKDFHLWFGDTWNGLVFGDDLKGFLGRRLLLLSLVFDIFDVGFGGLSGEVSKEVMDEFVLELLFGAEYFL